MVTYEQTIQVAKAYVQDVCPFMNINPDDIKIRTVAHITPIYGIPQFAAIEDTGSKVLVLSDELINLCRQRNGFTQLRTEVYAKVRMMYLAEHPSKIYNQDILLSSLAYACALMTLKGLCLPKIPSLTQRILREDFGVDATIIKMPNILDANQARLTDSALKKYIEQYWPSVVANSSVTPLAQGAKGSKENPFDNVYEAVDFIKSMEQSAHNNDKLLQSIEQQKFFYDPALGAFRIHWASPFVSQYKNDLGARSFMVNQMAPMPPNKGDIHWFSFKPNLYGHKFLYRGQSDHYEGLPCVPNLFRDKKKNEERDYIEFLIFSQELELLIKTHPLVQLFEKGFELLHDTFHIRVNYQGLAQHYYNKSRMLDLSSDLDVMKFFATTDYDWKTDTYYPCTDLSRVGVIYCYELQYPGAFQQHKGYSLKTIGKQPFMRPGAQCGFLLDMEMGVDLKKLPEVKAIYFRQNADISKEIFKKSNDGEEYFSNDILQRAWKDRFCARRDNKVVSMRTVEYNVSLNDGSSKDSIVEKLNSIGITVDDYIPKFTDEELDEYYQSIKNGWWQTFCEDIHFYGAEDEIYRQALRELPQRPEYKKYFYRVDG